ncbi:MAG: heparinase II/III family protein, partial [Phycisphaerae bacterium]|nr:heparinase II/III family protein [Phycisphaerae bacterium]
ENSRLTGLPEALLFGPDEQPESSRKKRPATGSRHLSGIGYAILRSETPVGILEGLLTCGPTSPGKGHPDRLGIILHGLGRELCIDPGYAGYGQPNDATWYYQSVSHNLITVDRTSQRFAEATCLFFQDEDKIKAARAASETLYLGVRLSRTLILDPEGWFLDIATAESDDIHDYDWLYHSYGTFESNLAFSPQQKSPGAQNGYEHIASCRAALTSEDWSATWRFEDGAGVSLAMAGQPETEVFVGDGLPMGMQAIGRYDGTPIGCLIARHNKARSAVWVTLIEPLRQAKKEASPSRVHLSKFNSADDITVAVEQPGKRVNYHISDAGVQSKSET